MRTLSMPKLAFLILSLLLTATCFSQHLITGRISASGDKKPIPYANIGIINTPVGTISNTDGSFQISIPEKHAYDTLLFSSLGYERQFIPVQSLIPQADVSISLTEKTTTLERVTVSAKKKKDKSYLLGNRLNNGGFLYADSVSAGATIALLIENKYPSNYAELAYPFLVEEVNLFINKNSADPFKLRVRLFQRDSVSGLPDKDLLNENVIINSSIKKGWLTIDLRPYRFIASQPFFLAIEWIMEDKDRLALLNLYSEYRKANPKKVTRDSTIVEGKKIGFWSYHQFSPGTHLGISANPFSLQHYTCYYRTNSFGGWKRSPVILTTRVMVIPVSGY
jgi:hypothetical protein